jgi:cephalosporin-C deacetylase-like acetyl esterase
VSAFSVTADVHALEVLDEVTPPTGQWMAFNQIQAVKEAVPMITSNHGHLARPEQFAS